MGVCLILFFIFFLILVRYLYFFLLCWMYVLYFSWLRVFCMCFLCWWRLIWKFLISRMVICLSVGWKFLMNLIRNSVLRICIWKGLFIRFFFVFCMADCILLSREFWMLLYIWLKLVIWGIGMLLVIIFLIIFWKMFSMECFFIDWCFFWKVFCMESFFMYFWNRENW